MPSTSEIKLNITMDANGTPEKMTWLSSDANNGQAQDCKAFFLSIWDANPQDAALRIDLWTKEMRTDEMDKLFFQTIMTMAQTYRNANGNETMSKEIEAFGYEFGQKVGLLKPAEK